MRPGAITFEALRNTVPSITLQAGQNSPTLPGMKYRHYAPKGRVKLISSGEEPEFLEVPVSYIGLHPPCFLTGYCFIAGSIQEYARELFSFFRESDRLGISLIYAEKVEEKDLGRAIMNRLHKAAGFA